MPLAGILGQLGVLGPRIPGRLGQLLCGWHRDSRGQGDFKGTVSNQKAAFSFSNMEIGKLGPSDQIC